MQLDRHAKLGTDKITLFSHKTSKTCLRYVITVCTLGLLRSVTKSLQLSKDASLQELSDVTSANWTPASLTVHSRGTGFTETLVPAKCTNIMFQQLTKWTLYIMYNDTTTPQRARLWCSSSVIYDATTTSAETKVLSCIFQPCHMVPHFQVLHFQRHQINDRKKKDIESHKLLGVYKRCKENVSWT